MQDNLGKTTSMPLVGRGPIGGSSNARHGKRGFAARYWPAILISMIVVPMIVVLGVFAALPAQAAGPPTVSLGSVENFAVVGNTTVTNTGATTVIIGNVGLAPGTSITGLTPSMVTGTIEIHNASANQSQTDLTAAYNDAAGRTLDSILKSGNLGGQTLAAGLYTSTSSLEISSGDLTLSGSASDVWIFQMASTLTVTTGRWVNLTGGAVAANVFWQVGSSATLGVNSTFVGTIMAQASVTLEHGATLYGRALARDGAVTLDANTVISPSAVIPEFTQVLVPLVGMMLVIGIVSKVRNQKK